MDPFDYLHETRLATAEGTVSVSVATHADGTVTVVAWLEPTGRRVGWASSHNGHNLAGTPLVHPLLAESDLAACMADLLHAACGPPSSRAAIGQQLVADGRIAPRDLPELLGWQWLLAELGEPRRLGELADEALPAPAHTASSRPPIVALPDTYWASAEVEAPL